MTITPRQNVSGNEDRCLIAFDSSGFPLVAVADGVGSTHMPHVAAEYVLGQLKTHVETGQFCLGDALDRLESNSLDPMLERRQNVGRTTVVAALEAEAHIEVAWVGNGGAFRFPGDFQRSKFGYQTLPWTAAQLVSPHIYEEKGQTCLTRTVGTDGFLGPASSLAIRKDLATGDIILICTDGIFSAEEVVTRRDDHGRTWSCIPGPLEAIFELLTEWWSSDALDLTLLENELRDLLAQMAREGILEDDASVGMLFSAQALAHRLGNRNA